MCGIAGIYDFASRPVDLRLLEAMTQVLAHRGPDGEGYVLLAPGRKEKPVAVTGPLSSSLRTVPRSHSVGFGHRRLAILDRSPLGRQPMVSEDERAWITYNGEVYNYVELRQELQQLGWRFRSMSDTEVILNAYLQWGQDCLPRLNGMFAFAIWDCVHDHLFCARDRLGMKPFYYRLAGDRLVFGSEIKALLQDSSMGCSPNLRMIHDFLAFGLQDHSEETFFEGVRQLPPGHSLVVEDGRLKLVQWWDVDLSEPLPEMSEEEAVRSFRRLFEDAVRLHLRSDVPVGSCLSGGLDSSSIVCTVQALLAKNQGAGFAGGASRRLKTFSSCFEDQACDERPYLRQVVERADTDSLEVFPDGRKLFDDMPNILWFQEEPFGGTSYLAQWTVMKAASEHGATVLLDGQGGDELLCGYHGYWGSHWGDLVRGGQVRNLVHEARAYQRQQARIHPTVWANVARATLPTGLVAQVRSWLQGHGSWMHPGFAGQYRDRSRWLDYEGPFSTALESHVSAYLKTHSLPALLHHEDRNSMAFSIEARLPFLDTRLVDFLIRLPARYKLKEGRTKVILREAMAGILPEAVRRRTDKMGFATPQDQWLRNRLRPDLEALFSTKAFEQRGYWDPRRLKIAYRQYCEGGGRIGASVWRWACLELWHQRFFP